LPNRLILFAKLVSGSSKKPDTDPTLPSKNPTLAGACEGLGASQKPQNTQNCLQNAITGNCFDWLLTNEICNCYSGTNAEEPLMTSQSVAQRIEYWPIDRLVFYARNPRKNDAAVDRMCASIREYGFKFPVLAMKAPELAGTSL
jgi:hypothetical protein